MTTTERFPRHSTRPRLAHIDWLRGLVIILMALDHARDFWASAGFSPTDLQQTDLAWFTTRWMTHFCAPLFVLLSGISAFLHGQNLSSKRELSRFLVQRGLWLILLELVVVNLSWQFAFNFVFVQVIWVLGWSMVLLAGLIYIPTKMLAVLSVTVIAGHNALNDAWFVALFGDYKWIWGLLHQQMWVPVVEWGFGLYITYPLFPWCAVMSLGYALGPLFQANAAWRRQRLLQLGVALCLLFAGLRAGNLYGDPQPWQQAGDWSHSLMSFFNTTKYPPSLQFLCMTLGPGLLLLAVSERWRFGVNSPVLVMGKVPLFFYLLHVPLLNAGAHLWTLAVYGQAVNFFNGAAAWPPDYQASLPLGYAAWLVLLLALYQPCRWYGRFKSQSANPWLSYL